MILYLPKMVVRRKAIAYFLVGPVELFLQYTLVPAQKNGRLLKPSDMWL
jgi:hypothetical protein